MSIVMACVLIARHADSDIVQGTAWIGMFLVAALSIGKLGYRELYLSSISLCLAIALWVLHPRPMAEVGLALNQATFMMAFILFLGLLYEAAIGSPSIRQCGHYITGQPPGRRFNSLYLGTGLMSVLFNLGVISLLVPLIKGGVASANPGDPLNPIRERRQLVAVQRGFAWGILWSPTALAPLTLLDLIPGIDRSRWVVIGFSIATLIMALGWFEDHLRFRPLARARKTPRPLPPVLPTHALLQFFAAFSWLLLLSVGFGSLFNDSIVYGLMVSCPVMMTGWLYAQTKTSPGPMLSSTDASATWRKISGILRQRLPLSAPVAVTLACSGFIGRAAASLVPAETLLAASGLDGVPDYLLLYSLPLLILAFSFLALSPIVTAVFLGSLLGGLPTLPADPTLIAIAISCGWALAMTASPFVTLVLLMVRTSEYSGVTLSIKWNMAFVMMAILVLLPVFYFLTGGQ